MSKSPTRAQDKIDAKALALVRQTVLINIKPAAELGSERRRFPYSPSHAIEAVSRRGNQVSWRAEQLCSMQVKRSGWTKVGGERTS